MSYRYYFWQQSGIIVFLEAKLFIVLPWFTHSNIVWYFHCWSIGFLLHSNRFCLEAKYNNGYFFIFYYLLQSNFLIYYPTFVLLKYFQISIFTIVFKFLRGCSYKMEILLTVRPINIFCVFVVVFYSWMEIYVFQLQFHDALRF